MDTRGCCHQYFLLSLVIFVMINVHISVPPPAYGGGNTKIL